MYDFTGLDDWSIPIAADLTSYPPLLRRFTGPRYIFLSRFAELAWFREGAAMFLPPFIPALGSVGVMALHIAGLAVPESAPIILTGMDLRYQAGKPHAKGSPTHTLLLAAQGRLSYPRYLASWYERPREKAPLASGGFSLTDAVLSSYRKVLAAIVARRGNIFTLEGGGLELGAARLSQAEASALLYASAPKEAPDNPAAGTKTEDGASALHPAWNAAGINAFLTGQLAELEAIASGQVREDELARMDCILLDFPENPPYPLTDAAFLRRLRESASWYALRLRRALSETPHVKMPSN